MHPERTLLRIGPVSSVLGLVLSVVAGAFHGGSGEPNNLLATLPQYAANDHWELVHRSGLNIRHSTNRIGREGDHG